MAAPPELVFADWLAHQTTRTDNVGKLARYAGISNDWPGTEDKISQRRFLRRVGLTELLAGLAIAWREYELYCGKSHSVSTNDRTQKTLFTGNAFAMELRTDPKKFASDLEWLEKLAEYYEVQEEAAQDILCATLESINYSSWPRAKIVALGMFVDRMKHGPVNIGTLIRANPIYGFQDASAVARSLIETATNALLIVQDNSNKFVAQLYKASFEADEKKRNELEHFLEDPDKRISLAVPMELASVRRNKSCEETIINSLYTGSDLGKLESLAQRCTTLGKEWSFLYTTNYRRFSAWSHFHMESSFHTPSFIHHTGGNYQQAIGRSIMVLYFGHHLRNLFMSEINGQLGAPRENVDLFIRQQVTDVTRIIGSCKFITTPATDELGRYIRSM
jgi:hypothetical protein